MSIRHHHDHEPASVNDPVCGMAINPKNAAQSREVDGRTYYLCSAGCASAFDADPGRYTTAHHQGGTS